MRIFQFLYFMGVNFIALETPDDIVFVMVMTDCSKMFEWSEKRKDLLDGREDYNNNIQTNIFKKTHM